MVSEQDVRPLFSPSWSDTADGLGGLPLAHHGNIY